MKPSEAAKEIQALIDATGRLGGPSPSDELIQFLDELAAISSLSARKKPLRTEKGSSQRRAHRVGASPKRASGVEMSKTIDELAKKLREVFYNDDRFESVLSDPSTQMLTKANVVTLYNRVFEQPRPLSRSMTKPDVFNAIRRERISRVRSGY